MPDVTKRYLKAVCRILDSRTLTNSGPMVQQLEGRLKDYLNCRNLVLTSSGTSALQIAIRALGLSGTIITTPFTYVATANAIAWLGLEPKFVDISERDLGLDPAGVANALDSGVSGLLATHVFGVPCDIDSLEAVARQAGIPTIYDAAAGFGATYGGTSLVNHGSMSILSFQASKILSTVEGGALVFGDDDSYERVRAITHQGTTRSGRPDYIGLNAKMSELHAAYGLLMLDDVNERIACRRRAFGRLRARLKDVGSVRLPGLHHHPAADAAYFPVLFRNESAVLTTLKALRESGIDARRYFYPALNTLPQFGGQARMPVAEDISRRMLCLTFAPWSRQQIECIAEIVDRESQRV